MHRSCFAIVLSMLLICGGCNKQGQFDADAIFGEAPNPNFQAQPAARGAAAVPDRQRRDAQRGDWNSNPGGQGGQDDGRQERELPSDREDWGKNRAMPSDELASQQQDAGQDREMPSDSMPSRTEKWGRERAMPSDSPNWGKDRKMPSESSFDRPVEDESKSDPKPKQETPKEETSEEPTSKPSEDE